MRNVARALLAALLALGSGALSGYFAFVDLGPGESAALRNALAAALGFVSGLAFGALVPRAWFLAFLASWGTLLLGLLGVVVNVRRGALPAAGSALVFFGPAALALCGAWLAARRRRVRVSPATSGTAPRPR